MGRPTILLLERDPSVIDVAKRCLVGDYELHVANTADLALRIAARRPIAVALLEATMAGMMPADLVSKLRIASAGVRVVFIADANYDLDRRHPSLGTQLRKPLTEERLVDAVQNALRLRKMSSDVELMRSSSGTYRSLRALASRAMGGAGSPGTVPPPRPSQMDDAAHAEPDEAPRTVPPPSRSARQGDTPPPSVAEGRAARGSSPGETEHHPPPPSRLR